MCKSHKRQGYKRSERQRHSQNRNIARAREMLSDHVGVIESMTDEDLDFVRSYEGSFQSSSTGGAPGC